MVINWATGLGRRAIDGVCSLGKSTLFVIRALIPWGKQCHSRRSLLDQVFYTGVKSLAIVLLSGLFIGMVVALQGFHTLDKFGATQEIGQLVALSVVRELGPVVTALLFAGRAGSAITAELGLMRSTEQLTSMQLMGVDPVWQVVTPRVWASIITLPLLTLLFDVVAIYGGKWVSVDWLGVDVGAYWSNMNAAMSFSSDVVNGLIKSVVFAVSIAWVATYQGFYSAPNARGIGKATTQSVVMSSLLVLGLDFILTAIMMGGW